uniref:DDE Tnp4 domain-containing protein n=1 Tax=Sinocyclocheilus grahami TaxID=75366 RepID=A0A672K966_SINGR
MLSTAMSSQSSFFVLFRRDDQSGFRQFFHMYVEHFNHLLELVAPFITKQSTQLRQPISGRDRLSITLRYLATGESFSSLSFQYYVGRSTVGVNVKETCKMLHHVLKNDYLKEFCFEHYLHLLALEYYYTQIALDGKHITILPPSNSGSTFRNYKCQYRFLYAHIGTQGRVSDGGVYAHCDLKEAMDRNVLNIPPDQHLPGTDTVMPFIFVANEAFPLQKHLMKPYPFRHLVHDQRVFNYRLLRARCVIENAFGILANRWRVFLTTIPLHPVSMITLADTPQTPTSPLDATLPSVPASRDRNGPRTAKEQRDKLKDYFVSAARSECWQEYML